MYALVNNFSTDADVPKQTMQDNITITGDNTTGKVTISGTVANGVSQIRYRWNEEEEQTISKNGETEINE